MKAFSSAVSITLHAAVGAALLLSATRTGRSDPTRRDTLIVFPPAPDANRGDGIVGAGIPGPIDVPAPDFSSIPPPAALPEGAVPQPSFSPVFSPHAGSGSSPIGGWAGVLTDEHAEVLAGPLPVYPDVLRQAGVEGSVMLEAVVDTTGRVLPQSIQVVSASHPGFVAPARQALVATLFRPAMVGGKPERMLVRIPYEFAIRNGTGHAR